MSVLHTAFIISQGEKCVHPLQSFLPSGASPFPFTLDTDSARMGFKHPKAYSKFHVHIKQNIRWLGWALAGERKGAVGHRAGWIGFPDSDSFCGFQ